MKLKDLQTKYNFSEVEKLKYQEWLKEKYFEAGDITKKPYTIVIPPPNITGKLHVGHVFDITIQDIIIRRKRMQGYDCLYLPGMDHASIATQAKVEAELRKNNISRYDLGKTEFLKKCWEWKERHENLIHMQWEKIGISVDYSKERFTLDQGLNEAVNKVFVQMYQEGLIYRGEKIINWDVQSKTALSNIEVDYLDIEGAYYHFIYPFEKENGGLELVTTRPETMFGDTAVMVNPKDKRYKKYIGLNVYIPNTNRVIPIIADDYVDMEFGTGVVKVTPAHDPNDFEVGLRHNLENIVCMEEDGTMNEMALSYKGLDRFECRKKVVADLTALGFCVKVEKMIHSVGHSERTGVIVEPRLSKQWFVKMDVLAKILIENQKTDNKVNFYPQRFENTLLQWMENIQDWCISRQLWWGHQIPAWYRDEEVYVGLEKPKGDGWVQDEDALDTWFSSGLWPFSTLGWPNDTSLLAKYFPNDTLVTGYDIIPFWVARMMFFSLYLTGKRPFENCLIHGLIRDEEGKKISKSLGNGIDIFEIFDKYGVDAVRYFLTTSSTPGQDLRYSPEKIEASWNYINKIWNISRFIGLNFESCNYSNQEMNPTLFTDIDKWILNKLNETIKNSDFYLEKFDFGEASKFIYKFTWDDFASWYIEMTKVVFLNSSEEEKINTCAVLKYILSSILKLLHPFMPFVTEEIYQKFNHGSIVVSAWPIFKKEFDFQNTKDIDFLIEIITEIRAFRSEKNIPMSKKISLVVDFENDFSLDKVKEYLLKFTNYDKLIEGNKLEEKHATIVTSRGTIYILLGNLINNQEEIDKLNLKKEKLISEIKRCNSLLKNPNFISKAPQNKITEENEKLANYLKQLEEVNKLLKEYDV